MAKCDLCGNSCPAPELVSLRDIYKSAGVNDVCPACDQWANKQLNEIRDTIVPQFRARIAKRVNPQTLFQKIFQRFHP